MGIKGFAPSITSKVPGGWLTTHYRIYGEIGPGERVAFSKLAVEKLEKTGRPFRVAIDVSIWQFQTMAGQGGSNPAIRTFYYRLLRLMSITVQPIFIFDGPHKPPFKRNKKSGHNGASVPNMLTKQMLKLFGYPFYQAPGEAEAECALLQREGIVDAVLSEDVDTLMFGCGMTLRNWSSEGARGSKSPTHVNVYEAKATKEGSSGLDREGMVLVALMSGGDYITEGIPGCGIKLACQAARAGYGHSLCKIPRNDAAAMSAWRDDLEREIKTNKSKFFRTKHNALNIPDTFPNTEVLGYYTHPVVSSASKIQNIRDETVWDGTVDIPGLRLFVSEAFEWTNRGGAIKFIRGLAPVLLVYKLRVRGDRRDSGYGDIVLTTMNEMELVRAIAGQRNHFTTDAMRELRLVYSPIDIVGLNLEEECDDSEDYGRDGLAPVNGDDEIEGYVSDTLVDPVGSPSKRGPSQYDPEKLDKVWVPATIARIGIPLKVEDYEESLKEPRKGCKTKTAVKIATGKTTMKNGGMTKGALDRFVKVSKAGMVTQDSIPKPASRSFDDSMESLPPIYLAPLLESFSPLQELPKSRGTRPARISARLRNEPTEASTKATRSKAKIIKPGREKLRPNTNPWSLASSSQTSPKPAPKITKSTTLRQERMPTSPKRFQQPEYIISSSPEILGHDPRPLMSSPPLPFQQSALNPASHLDSNTPKRHHSRSPSTSRANSPSNDPFPDPFTEPGQQWRAVSANLHTVLDIPDTVTISRRRGKRDVKKPLDTYEEPPSTPSRSRLSRSEDRPSPREKLASRPLSTNGSDGGVLLDPGLNSSPPSAVDPVVRKIDFGPAAIWNFDGLEPEDQNHNFGEDQEEEEEEDGEDKPSIVRPYSRTPPRSSVPTEIIDLSSSPPLPRSRLSAHSHIPSPSPVLQQQPQHQAAPRRLSQLCSSSPSSQAPAIKIPTKPTSVDDEPVIPGNGKDSGKLEREKGKKKYIRIRESIGGGAWKDVDEDEVFDRRTGVRREGVWRRSQVEVLDLTGE